MISVLRNIIVLLLLLVFPNLIEAQTKHTLSGYVKDAATGEFLPGANVYLKEIMQGTSTNSYGFYSLTVPSGNYTLGVSFMEVTFNTKPVAGFSFEARYCAA